jgi:hypothetical protein
VEGGRWREGGGGREVEGGRGREEGAAGLPRESHSLATGTAAVAQNTAGIVTISTPVGPLVS